MNKNFEVEYKKDQFQEIPDLWERIEAGLTEKPSTSIEQPFWNKERMKKVSYSAAAILCLSIMIPSLLLLGKNKNDSMSENQMDATYDMKIAMDETGNDSGNQTERISTTETTEESDTEALVGCFANQESEKVIEYRTNNLNADIIELQITVTSILVGDEQVTLYGMINNASTTEITIGTTAAFYISKQVYLDDEDQFLDHSNVSYTAQIDYATKEQDIQEQIVAYQVIDIYQNQ